MPAIEQYAFLCFDLNGDTSFSHPCILWWAHRWLAIRNLSIVLAGGSSTQKFTGYFTVEKIQRSLQRSSFFNYLYFVVIYSVYVRVCFVFIIFYLYTCTRQSTSTHHWFWPRFDVSKLCYIIMLYLLPTYHYNNVRHSVCTYKYSRLYTEFRCETERECTVQNTNAQCSFHVW